jgi:prepilin-type N-terminal cleavage/methylation domain-containing protein
MNKVPHKNRLRTAFSLIELSVSIALIGIVMGTGLSLATQNSEKKISISQTNELPLQTGLSSVSTI